MDEIQQPLALHKHAMRCYELMHEQSVLLPNEMDGDKRIRIWEGHLTKIVMNDMGLSNPYYTKITTLLKHVGSIEMIKRGGGGSASVWVLHHAPKQDDLEQVDIEGYSPISRNKANHQQTQQMFRDLSDRIGKLEDTIRVLYAEINLLKQKAA